ncbi:MAG: corrinoid protein [Candidatus Bathyarchaeia archaeon]|jgi:5-methyltetrahydrofolate--homocysteine methyltransferase
MNDLVAELVQAVTDGDIDKSKELTTRLVSLGMEPVRILTEGLTRALMIVGDRFGKGDAYLTDLMMSAEAMKTGLQVIEPELGKSKVERKYVGIVVIGTVEGDIHDIGKTIVATMFEVNGFKVYDLGCDVNTEVFVKKVEELRPNILGLSALLSTTMGKQAEVIKALTERGLRSGLKIMVGGAPVTPEWAREIGADDSAPDAVTAVSRAIKSLETD